MASSKQFPRYRSIFNLLSVLIIISILAAGGSTNAAAKSPSQEPLADSASQQQQQINLCLAAEENASYHPLTGNVSFAAASPQKPIRNPVEGLQSASPEEAARGYLSECGSLFGLSNQANDLVVNRQRMTEDGRNVVRFQQNYQGIPVIGGELLMQLTSANDVILVNGNVLPRVKLDTQPSVDPAAAQQAALELVAAQNGLDLGALKVSEAELWVYSPLLIESRIGPASLVWRMEVTPMELAPIRELVLINAHDGSVVLDINQVDTAKNRLTYTANNGTVRPGTLVCNEANPTCSGGDTDEVNAHTFAGGTYDFYNSYHGRDSINNAGMSLISTVHYSVNYCNAFWDGYQMTYGDGCFIVTDDVVAHELTHGVTEYESHLIYYGQPGAINESFSDIWGEFYDLTNGLGTDTAGVRWLMGEDVEGGAIRDMQDPTTFFDPDRMGSIYYYTGSADNGGVHSNSGVGNKAAYLITDGDTFNGYTITGLGVLKTAKIFYEAQTNILVSSSNYHSLRNALNQACTTLTGTNGITSADCIEVNEATLATEMDTTALPPPAPVNDSFFSPLVISSMPYTNTQDITGAITTITTNDPVLGCAEWEGYNAVWYSFTPSTSGTLALNTIGSNYDTILGVWKGTNPASLTSVACNDDISYPTNLRSQLSVPLAGGQAYIIEVAGWDVGTLTLNASFTVVTAPTIISPKGTITDTTPTYKWIKVPGATQYRYQLVKGTKTIYTKMVAPSACNTTTCSNTPTTKLGYYTYKWRVQAKIGGVWKSYTPYKTFRISPAQPGMWSGTGIRFYVLNTSPKVDNFTTYIYVNGCGYYSITRLSPVSIVNKQFSFGGSYYASGAFSTAKKSSGLVGFNRFFLGGCGYVSGGPFRWNAAWRDSSQPFIEINEGETITLTVSPEFATPFDVFKVEPDK